jgi:hypothetical protein
MKLLLVLQSLLVVARDSPSWIHDQVSVNSGFGGLNLYQDIRVNAVALEPTDSYFVVLPSVDALDHLAYIQVKAIWSKKGKQVLALERQIGE